ncbi:MAG: dTMP kinase [Gracilibacteraceae bacterium]|jgi:dTMP kinase|nr:dTMP kinase [Gracilibacteraceae bacterium]
MTKGKFIVLEGIDGSGLSTQAALLVPALAKRTGRKTLLTKEPTDGPAGLLIRQALSGRLREVDQPTLALLFAADRLDHLRNLILPALARREIVVCDRYLWSSRAYQGLECDAAWVDEINRFARQPDLTVFLRVRPAVSLARIAQSRPQAELFEKEETLRRVLAEFETLFAAGRAAGRKVAAVDGEAAPASVAAELERLALAALAEN